MVARFLKRKQKKKYVLQKLLVSLLHHYYYRLNRLGTFMLKGENKKQNWQV